MKQTLRIFMLLAVALLTAGQVWARGGGPVKFVYAAAHGTASASAADENRQVTITISPNEDWCAINGDVTAVATVVNSNVAEARRAEAAEDETIGLGEPIAVTCTATNVFTLKLPEDVNKNVLVTVKFHKCESVSYINAEGVLCDGADGHPDKATAYVLDGSETTLAAGWYVANGEVSFNHQLTASGDVHIILKDGAVMSIGTAQSPVSDFGIYGNGHSISIYAQSTGDSKGKLQINASQFGIFAEGGNVGIYGGEVTATGSTNGCDGICATKSGSTGGSITLSNATVTASGSVGIEAYGGSLTAENCTIIATGTGSYGTMSTGGNTTFTNCEVTATGGQRGIYTNNSHDIIINGGEVEATGTSEYGIYAGGGSVSVTGATITAGSVYAEKGITFDGSSVTVSGWCYNASSGDIIIKNGSSVTSTASGTYSLDNDGGSININGGEVNAKRRIYGKGGISLTNAIVKVEESDASSYAIYAVNNGLTIDGSTVTTTGKIFAEQCDISICNGSKVIVTGGIYVGNSSKNLSINNSEVEFTGQIFAYGRLTIDGSKVTAIGDGSGEIFTVYGALTLGWSNPDDCIYAKTYGTYSGSVVIADGKTFIAEDGNTYSGTMDKVEDAYPIDGKTLRPYNGGPLSLTATTVTKTSATLSWTAGDEQAQWVVSWSTDNGSTWSDPVTVDKKQYELTGLSAGRKVCVEVKTVLGENEYSFPATITFCTPIDYLDISGTTQTCSGYTVFTGSETTLAAGWYVADGEVSFNHQLNASGDVHIILKDGAAMSIGTAQSPVSDHGIYGNGYSISIYAQSTGESKGKLQINASGVGIFAEGGNVGIYGGEVTATGGTYGEGIFAYKSGSTGGSITLSNATVTASGAYGILAQGGLIINSGTVTSNGSSTNEGHGICASGCDITINGGKVTATSTLGNGIYAYGGNVEINGGEVEATGSLDGYGIYAFKKDGNGGCITLGWTDASDYIHANGYFANGGTLSIASGKTFIDEAGNTYSGTMDKVEDAYPIDGKTLRPYIAQEITIGTSGWATWCSSKEYTLPDGLTAYTVSGLSADGKSVVLTPAETIMADTPLLLKGTAGTTYTALWASTGSATGLVSSTIDNVLTFYGNPTDEIITTGNYCVLGKSYVLYKGTFLLVDTDSGIPANKCLLTLSGSNAARQLNISVEGATNLYPSIIAADESTQEGGWYDLQGRKLSGEPTKHGIYIFKGKKVKR